jgi:hypothetical protein
VWWLKWLLKLSFVNYAYEILLTSQVEGLTIAFQPTNFPRPVPVKGDEVFIVLSARRFCFGARITV